MGGHWFRERMKERGLNSLRGGRAAAVNAYDQLATDWLHVSFFACGCLYIHTRTHTNTFKLCVHVCAVCVCVCVRAYVCVGVCVSKYVVCTQKFHFYTSTLNLFCLSNG